MNKVLGIILCGALAFSCANNSSRSDQNIPASTPIPDPPYGFDGSEFNKVDPSELLTRDQQFPPQMRDILENAPRIQLFETEVCSPGGETLTPKVKGRFQGCKVVRQADVTNPEARQRLVEEIIVAMRPFEFGAACFDPRHGVRAEHDGRRVELLICFECINFRGVSNEASFAGGFSTSAEESFKRILTEKTVSIK